MTVSGVTDEGQLMRQTAWLKESWLWLLESYVFPSCRGRPVALDVGSGPGVVAEALSPRMDVVALDLDPGCVEASRQKGLEAVEGDAYDLPFEDGEFDVVYCSFLMLWLERPERALREMTRVSRRWVVCLAEPDHGGRIDHPASLSPLRDMVCDGLRKDGADPCIGRKLNALYSGGGLSPRIGIHPGAWSIDRLRAESEAEWAWIEGTAGPGAGKLRPAWDAALEEGSLFQFNPIFYALARKDGQPTGLSRQV